MEFIIIHFMEFLKLILKGIVLGVANVIPGVSGGTMAVVFNVYDRIIDLISPDLKKIFRSWKFWLPLAAGMGIGIIVFSKVITALLGRHPIPTTYFFIGLILGSIPLIVRKMRTEGKSGKTKEDEEEQRNEKERESGSPRLQESDREKRNHERKGRVLLKLAFLVGLMMVLSMKFFGGDVDARKAEEKRKALDQGTVSLVQAKTAPNAQDKANPDAQSGENSLERQTWVAPAQSESQPEASAPGEKLDIAKAALLLVAGAAAAVAMIIPGISGSFLLLALGMYGSVMAAISRLDILFLIPFALGVLLGLVFGAALVRFLMKKIPSHTYACILGLVVGSVAVIFPGFGTAAVMLVSAATLALGFFAAYLSSRNE